MAASINNVKSDFIDSSTELSVYKINETHSVAVTLFENVKNVSELRKMLMEGKLECSFINPAMVVDIFQVLVATHKAIKSKEQSKMTTKTVFTEIVNNLSCRRSISHALKTFGVKDTDCSLLTVTVNDETGEKRNLLIEKVDGSVVSLQQIPQLTNFASVKKEYGITPTELEVGTLLDAVVERMATKDFVSY